MIAEPAPARAQIAVETREKLRVQLMLPTRLRRSTEYLKSLNTVRSQLLVLPDALIGGLRNCGTHREFHETHEQGFVRYVAANAAYLADPRGITSRTHQRHIVTLAGPLSISENCNRRIDQRCSFWIVRIPKHCYTLGTERSLKK